MASVYHAPRFFKIFCDWDDCAFFDQLLCISCLKDNDIRQLLGSNFCCHILQQVLLPLILLT
jgi:hypothetical protein